MQEKPDSPNIRMIIEDAFVEPTWKSRPSRALVAIGPDSLTILDHVGADMAYLHNVDAALVGGMLFEEVKHEHGLYIWEGRVRGVRYDTQDGTDYDEFIEGDFRELTEDERKLFISRQPLWTDSDWHDGGEL